MLDAIAISPVSGMEVVRGCHEYEIKANYKLICENSYDGYHLDITHSSFVDYMRRWCRHSGLGDEYSRRREEPRQWPRLLRARDSDGRPVAQWLRCGAEEARLENRKRRRRSSRAASARSKADRISVTNRNMVIFPNSIINDQQTVLLRTVTPTAHNRISFSLVDRPEG